MGIVRHILNIFLVVLIFFAGLPHFCPEDADRNSRINLGDAIQHVTAVAQSACDQKEFTGSLGRAISTLNALAGIKTVIKSENETRNSATGNLSNTPFLLSKNYNIKNSTYFIKTSPDIFSCYSIDHTVDSPPPRTHHV